jgi:hypothetical protein
MSIYIGLKFDEITAASKQASGAARLSSGAIEKIKKLMANDKDARVFTDDEAEIPELRAFFAQQGLPDVEIATFSNKRLEDYI